MRRLLSLLTSIEKWCEEAPLEAVRPFAWSCLRRLSESYCKVFRDTEAAHIEGLLSEGRALIERHVTPEFPDPEGVYQVLFAPAENGLLDEVSETIAQEVAIAAVDFVDLFSSDESASGARVAEALLNIMAIELQNDLGLGDLTSDHGVMDSEPRMVALFEWLTSGMRLAESNPQALLSS